jgi:nitrous-oxide reductase
MSEAHLKAEYAKSLALNEATAAVIRRLNGYLEEKRYEKFAEVDGLVTNARKRYAKTEALQEKARRAIEAGDMQQAALLEKRAWQEMVKTADMYIKAKDTLVKYIATPQSHAARRGEEAFNEGGCSGCHIIGKVSSGPNLIGVLGRHRDGVNWVSQWIKEPQTMYNDPYIRAMTLYFKIRMPNQHMSDEETKDIIEYFRWIDENANLF